MVILRSSSLNLENAVVLNDLVVEVPEDALVVVDQPEEAPSNVAKFTFANGQARRDLTEEKSI